MFYLHLKENEFRFNNRHNDIYAYTILKNLRNNNFESLPDPLFIHSIKLKSMF